MIFKISSLDIKKFKGVDSENYRRVLGCNDTSGNEVADIIAIFGENGSGKTTVAEAMKLLFPNERKNYKEYDVRFQISCFNNNERVNLQLELQKKGKILESEKITCNLCKSDNCLHASSLKNIISNFQQVVMEKESSSLNLYFYHKLSGDRVEFDLNNLKKIIFTVTGLSNIEKKIEKISSEKKLLKKELARFQRGIGNIESKLNTLIDNILRYLDPVSSYNQSLWDRINDVLKDFDYLFPQNEGNIYVKTLDYEDFKSRLIAIQNDLKELLRYIDVQIENLKKSIPNLEREKKEIVSEINTQIKKLNKLKEEKSKLEEHFENEELILTESEQELRKKACFMDEEYKQLLRSKEELEKKQKDLVGKILDILKDLYSNTVFQISFDEICTLSPDEIDRNKVLDLLDNILKSIVNYEKEFLKWKENTIHKVQETRSLIENVFKELHENRNEIDLINHKLSEIEKEKSLAQQSIDEILSRKKEDIKKQINDLDDKIQNIVRLISEIQEKAKDKDKKISDLKEEIEKSLHFKERINKGIHYISLIVDENFEKIVNDYKALLLEQKRIEEMVEKNDCIAIHQLNNLEKLKDESLRRITMYLSDKITKYFNFLTDHKRFNKIVLVYQGGKFSVKVYDKIDGKEKIIENDRVSQILNGQAIAALNLSLQVSTLEMVKGSLDESFSLLVLDDPTQAFDTRRKEKLIRFLEKLADNGIQIIILTFDETVLNYQGDEPSGLIVAIPKVSRIVERISYVIKTKDSYPFKEQESFIKVESCRFFSGTSYEES